MNVYVLHDLGNGIPQSILDQWAVDLTRWCELRLNAPAPQGWGCTCAVRAASATHPFKQGEFEIQLIPGAAPQGELADHGETADDAQAPVLHIYPEEEARSAGAEVNSPEGYDAITVAITHDVAEAEADRWGNRSAPTPLGAIKALEIADATQPASERIGSTLAQSITLPNYWSPPPSGNGPFDSVGAVTEPFQVLPGGYEQTWDGTLQRWTMSEEHYANVPAPRLRNLRSRVNRRNARLERFA